MPHSLEDLEDALTTEEVAKIVHATPRTVRLWIQAGDLSVIRVGKRFLITRRALTEYINRKSTARGAAS